MFSRSYRRQRANECDRLAAATFDSLERRQHEVDALEWRLLAGEFSEPPPVLKLVWIAP
jgi:hypothetical protein